MKKRLLTLSLVIGTFISLTAQTVLINLGTTTVETSTLYTTNEAPWELVYGPGDSLWMTTKNGKVYRIDPNTGGATQLLDYSGIVYQAGEAGMLGMTFHPNFAANPFVYIAYTYTNAGNKERLSRFTYNGTALVGEQILIDNIVANTIHNGSRLVILNNNTILMTTGDAANTALSQNTNSPNGKVLRVHLDGSIPVDNPVPGNPVYTFGHRNPQGLALHPNGNVYSTEHGPANNDEFQIIEPGRNYGWPNVAGFCDNDQAGEAAFCTANNVKEPLASWNPAPGSTWAPSDLVWYGHPSIPEFQNRFLVAFLKTAKVRTVQLDPTGESITSQADYFINQWGRLRDITTSPDGSIYLATNVSPYRLIKIRAAGVTPVSLTRFTVTCNQQQYNIRWTTQAEQNNKHFLLFKSIDRINFDLVATIVSRAPGGNSTMSNDYEINDNGNPGEPVYYRLVSEDLDGRQKDYGIITPNCGSMGNQFLLLPNPTSNKASLTMNGVNDLMNINVHNTQGQNIYQTRAKGTITFPSDKWPPGVYIISVTNEQREIVYRNRLVVQ